MDERLDEVIKNIVHIDKGAAELRGRVEDEIKERKKRILDEIEALKIDIAQEEKGKIKKFEEQEIMSAREKAQEIINMAKVKGENMTKAYEEISLELVKNLFDEILDIKNI